MKVNFLSAKLPLTKTLDSKGGVIRSYPLVRNFTSHSYSVPTLALFKDTLIAHSRLKHCFLKGELIRPIQNESRAGMTNSVSDTKLLVLDYDGDALVDSIDEMLYEIYPPLTECSRIVQYSARSGFEEKKKLRSHIFFMLKDAVSPELLKQWVLDKNFRTHFLRKQLKLSANAMSLVYALDQTVNQNDKLIFIAPPELGKSIKDPIKNRIVYIPGKRDFLELTYPVSPEIVNEEKLKVITELRETLGLPKRKPRTKIMAGEEICTNPGKVMVTGQKKERGFIYMNFNGGDSWGYYFSEKNPTIVRNFKGEPFFYLKDVAPDLAKEYCKIKKGTNQGVPVVFRDIASDQYFNMLVNTETEEVISLHQTKSKDRLMDFLAQYGVDAPEFIEDYEMVFDPHTCTQYDLGKKWVNKFTPTKYMLAESVSKSMPRVLKKVIKHICVDEETYNHFINWLAFIFQKKDRTETAWVFQGTQGTGKGLVFHQIIRKLLGHANTQPVTLETLQENFNAYLQDKFVIFVDEVDIEHSGHSTSQGKMMNKLKNLITEPTIGIRAMHRGTENKPNFANFIFASNDVASLYIADNDRRFNIAPRQNERLDIPRTELEAAIDVEISNLAAYLRGFKVNEVKARSAMQNQAKRDFVMDGKTSIQEFFQCFNDGDLTYFNSAFHDDSDFVETDRERLRAKMIFRRWEEDAFNEIETKVSSADLARVYFSMQGGTVSSNKFGRICTKNSMQSQTIRIARKSVKGFITRFYLEDDYILDLSKPKTKRKQHEF